MGKALSRASAASTSSPPDSSERTSTPNATGGGGAAAIPIHVPSNVDTQDSFFSISIPGLKRLMRHGVVLKGKRHRPSKRTTLAEFVRQLKLPVDVAFVDCLSDEFASLSKEHAGLFLVCPPQSLCFEVIDALDLYTFHNGGDAAAAAFVWLDVLCFPQRTSETVRRGPSKSRLLASPGSWGGSRQSSNTPPHSPHDESQHKTNDGGRLWMRDRDYSFAQIAKFADFAVFVNSFKESDSLVKSHFQSQLEITGISECRKLCKVLFTPPMERQFVDALVQDFENTLYYFVDIDTANARDATSDAATIKTNIKAEEWSQMNFIFTGAMRTHIRLMLERELKAMRDAHRRDVQLLKLGLGRVGMLLDLQVFTPSLEEELLELLPLATELVSKATGPAKAELQLLEAMAYEYLGLRLISIKDTSSKMVEYFEKALELRNAVQPKTIPAARTKVALGRAQTLVGRYDDALVTLTDAIEMTRAVRGGSHPELASALSAKATVLFKMERLSEANAEFEKANQIKKKVRNTMTVLLEDPTFKKDIKRLGGAALALFDQADEEVSNAAKGAVEKALFAAEQRGSVRPSGS